MRPFIEGLNTDSPQYDVRPRQSVSAQDLIAPQGMARQRRGWSYAVAGGQVVADTFGGVYRAQFILSDETRTVLSTTAGDVWMVSDAGGTAQIYNGSSGEYLPRAVYRDELWLCHQGGQLPALRYSGMDYDTAIGGTVLTYTAGQSIVTATSGAFAAAVVPGSYIRIVSETPAPANDGIGPFIWARVVERVSDTVLTVEGIRTEDGGTMADVENPRGVAFGYPCVSVYEAGTVSQTADYTVTGGKWQTGDWGSVQAGSDCLFVPVAGTDTEYMMLQIDGVSSDTLLSVLSTDNTISNQPYSIARRMPFKDVASHQDSLWGTGVAQHPNRVYVGPPGWNPAFPPGVPEPFDPESNFHSPTRRDFFLNYIEVPTPYDGDVVEAILPTSNPLLVLKGSGVYGTFGAYPTFTTELIEEGAGCIDIRSAWSLPSGPFWAGENGIFTYRNGRVIDITSGRINREWRSNFGRKMESASSYCTLGEVYNHIFVSALNDDGLHETYVFDMANGTWVSKFSNHKMRNAFSSKVPGEKEKLLWVGPDFQGYIMDSADTVDTAITGNERDGDGTKPRMKAWTGTNLSQRQLDEESKMLDLAVTANVYDGGTAGSTQLATSIVVGGGLVDGDDQTIAVGDINSDTTDRVDRTYFRNVNANGRYHQIRFDVDTFDTDDHASGAKVEIAEVSMSFMPTADRT